MRNHLKLLIGAAVLLWMASCITQSRRARICATCVLKETVKDSTGAPKITDTPFDTLLWMRKHQGKELTFKDCPELDHALVSQGTITASQDGVKSTITKTAKGITFKCETDSLKETIRLLRRQIETPHYRMVTRDVPARCTLSHRTRFDDVCRWVFWIVCGLVIGGVGVFFIRRRL